MQLHLRTLMTALQTARRTLVALGLLCMSSQAVAGPITDAQRKALTALEMEFDRHHVTGSSDTLKDAFNDACKSGYNLACQRGAWVVYGKPNLDVAAELFDPACDDGDPVACQVVGWQLDRSAPQTSDRDRTWRAAALKFRVQCDEGFVPACHEYAWFLYLNKGFKADPRSGITRWKNACEEGDLPSCTTMGQLYATGATGVSQNASEAEANLTKACDGGFTQGCFEKGLLLDQEWTILARDEWYGKACEDGHREACWKLAHSYLSGAAEPPKEDRVIALVDRGCELGNAKSCYEAGQLRINQETPDYQVASERHHRACDLGDVASCASLVTMITEDKIEGTVKTAPQAFESACLKRGSAAACTALALELFRGVDLARDPARGRALLHRACVDSDSPIAACTALGTSYEQGQGGERDRTIAAKYFRWSCDQGDAQACLERGLLVSAGKGITRDDHDALAMYRKACEGGLAEGCHMGGVIFDEGTYVPRDIAAAGELYKSACDGGFGDGCTGFGKMLELGYAGEADPIAARAAYERGVALGSRSSMRENARMLWHGLGGKPSKREARSLAARACQAGDVVSCQGAAAL